MTLRTTIIMIGIAAALLLSAPAASRAGNGPEKNGAGRLLDGVDFDRLSPRERERIVIATVKLARIHAAAGTPTSREVEGYLEAVEKLARFLKRETVLERRRLNEEAKIAFGMVDRDWIDRAFQVTSRAAFPIPEGATAKLHDQTAALKRVGELLKEERAIVRRQKGIVAAAERRYRDILRLHQEGLRTYETLDHAGAEAVLFWMVNDLDRVLAETVRPAHDRQIRLISLFKKVSGAAGETAEALYLAKLYREYSSKVRAIGTRIEQLTGNSN